MNRCKLLAGVGVLFLASGCALTTDVTSITYSSKNVLKVPGAEGVTVKVVLTDSRTDKERVSVKKNGYGMEMAPILAPNVARTVGHAIELELTNHGFTLGEGNLVVTADLNKFYSDVKMGF